MTNLATAIVKNFGLGLCTVGLEATIAKESGRKSKVIYGNK